MTTQTQYKLEDFKVGQEVKVLVGLGNYISDHAYSRLGQVGKIIEIDYRNPSIMIEFETKQGSDFPCKDRWYLAEEIQPIIFTNAQRQEEINRLEAKVQTLNTSIVQLKKEIKDNPEKIKAEGGDKVRFKYRNLDNGNWIYMYIMTSTQAEQFGGQGDIGQNFRFQGPDASNNVNVVNTGGHDAFEFCKKGDCQWIGSSKVDWSGILTKSN
jgi:outer membrane murein-binding lipoprotein Lpp